MSRDLRREINDPQAKRSTLRSRRGRGLLLGAGFARPRGVHEQTELFTRSKPRGMTLGNRQGLTGLRIAPIARLTRHASKSAEPRKLGSLPLRHGFLDGVECQLEDSIDLCFVDALCLGDFLNQLGSIHKQLLDLGSVEDSTTGRATLDKNLRGTFNSQGVYFDLSTWQSFFLILIRKTQHFGVPRPQGAEFAGGTEKRRPSV